MSARSTSDRLLIVNADDFGLTDGVCRAILRAHREGIVTSTSALVLAPAFERRASWLVDTPEIGIGVHLAAVGEDPPLLSAREIPTLVDKRGNLPKSWRQLLPLLALRRVDLADIEREFAAQGEAVRGAVGAHRITHLDTHQHLHLWPDIASILCRLADRWGVPAIRGTRSRGRSAKGRMVNRLGHRLDRTVAAAGLLTPDAFAGFDEAGAVALVPLIAMIEHLAASREPTSEIGVHPGEHGDAALDRYAWGYRWGDELDALISPRARAAVGGAGFTLGSFSDLRAASS